MNPLVLLLVLLWAPPTLPPERSGAVEDPLAKAELLYDEGSSLYEAADYSGAIQKFTAALALVTASDSTDAVVVKRPLLWNIAIAHERSFAVDHDVRHLRQAQILYRNYMLLLNASETEARTEAETNLARVQKLLDEQAKQPVPAPRPVVSPSTDVAPRRESKRDLKIGVGLLVPGVVSVATGAVLAGVGSTYEPNARAQVNKLTDLGVPPGDPAWDQGNRFIAQERQKGRTLMAVGGTLVGVGAVLAGVGTYYVVKWKRSRVRVAPTVGIFGMTLSGRF